MNDSDGLSYAASGVSIDAGNQAKRRIRELVRTTFNPQVLSELGLFGGLFRLDAGAEREPVLVASADGVGTKLKIAFLTGVHHTVGYDLVAHCVNDILVQGARPLFFLDYIATGVLKPEVVTQVVDGLVRGCREFGCALIGGETAEMPDFYDAGEYDLAGFIVGVVERGRILDGSAVRPGDVVLGLPSAGLHTNGYSLARKIFFDHLGLWPETPVEELGGTVGEVLLRPHRGYLKSLGPCLERGLVRALAHITGGGLLENIPRILPAGCSVEIRRGAWPVPPVFTFMAREGRVAEAEMFRVFNMGIGMAVIVAPDAADEVETMLRGTEGAVYRIGAVTAGAGGVVLR
ncbi:MAG TPA: phosphoribosylformylglycinamidine cyclo-ligase [Acidobacteriota bacterium]|nr:phosphoribosylformylglycinamidine cyclo-ligase [Acidobacteriota bacterium]HOT01859.1 phosphoribosylformylglycinamidine cyclo-ligase [Acidobacteriota bacterium]HQF87696.1 phosphoribosylformylglycinamidine cyclo-ligase [Acidobacteriota bacterium]HQG93164.1 phosphoribosylformylglycinamidine cyclo-ligase [Acidobacteriota bacterium]HQK88630.1 phosphoribosylformylglycinamidine cyclo-ligase [Acidobacteriota bacterium]